MDDKIDSKKAIDVLIKMMDDCSFSAEQKEAILKAIGVLSWTMLSESRIKNRKSKNIRLQGKP